MSDKSYREFNNKDAVCTRRARLTKKNGTGGLDPIILQRHSILMHAYFLSLARAIARFSANRFTREAGRYSRAPARGILIRYRPAVEPLCLHSDAYTRVHRLQRHGALQPGRCRYATLYAARMYARETAGAAYHLVGNSNCGESFVSIFTAAVLQVSID